MVAVVSGSGLGLFNSSASSLGGAGSNGNPVVGRGRDRVYVNSSTGNLIVQSVDETLAALGLDFAGVRTYNSQGLADEDNNDQWRSGVQQRIYKLTGTVGMSGSTVTKVFGDGAEILYTWNATRSRYESGDGDGANDFLTWNGTSSRWTWTDGSARSQEEYGLIDGVQRIRISRDADGNTVNYNYDDTVNLKLLTSVTMVNPTGLPANAQTVTFTYTGTNLTGIQVSSGGVVQTLTRYAYDTSNRLQTVTVDLTPGDNSVADNVTYTTTYTYDSTSTRIASITQKDGSSVGFQYQLINGEYRLWKATDAENRVTTFTYNTVAGTAVTSTAVNAAQLSTSGTVNAPQIAGALTASPAGWNNAAIRDASTSTVADPRVAFDANGNGFLVWRVSSNVVAQRYTRATNSWGPEVILDNRTQTTTLPSLSMDAAGNAIVAWVQSDGTANSVYASRYDAATGLWTNFANPIDTNAADANLVATRPVNTGTYTLVTAINGTRAAVAWQHNQADTGSVYNLYVARLNGSTWSLPTSVEALTATAGQQSIAIDDQGNIAVAFQQADATATNVYVNRFAASTTTWSGAVLRDTAATATASDPRIAFDASGNGIMIYRQGSNVFAQRYTRSTNSWSTTEATLDSLTTNATSLELAIDANGTGVAAWVQADASGASVYAARFNGTTWSAAVPIDAPAATANNPVNAATYSIKVSVSGNRAAIVWQQDQAASGVYDLYVARFDGTSWSARELVEQRADNAALASVAIDSLGNVSVAFQQNDGSVLSAMVSRYNVAAASSYYVVPSGATWQSIANAVYGSNTVAAGNELQTRLAPQTLATNVQLGGFPATLAVPDPVSTSFYQVVSGDTWSIVTNKLYGTTDANAIAALQAYCGTMTLTVSGRLYVPATLKYQAVGTTATVYQSTSVLNSLGIATAYEQDTQGRVTRMLVAGIDTRFAYDSTTGNVSSITEDPTGLNRITTFAYDGVTGVLRFKRDNLGNTVERTYNNTTNQLLSEIQYTTPDPDAINSGASPTGALTTRFAYDAESHLRFVISADGRVTEHQYNAAGQRVLTFNHLAAAYGSASPYTETDLQNWVAGAGAGVRERIDYAYDWRGNLQTLTRWEKTTTAGAGTGTSSISYFVYDQRGQLLQTVDPRGSAPDPVNPNPNQAYSRTYVYDGLGRVKTAVEWLKPADSDGPLKTRTTLTTYDDVGRGTTVLLDNGLSSLSTFNRAGELISVNNGALGSKLYSYDAMGRLRIVTDPLTLVRQFSFYDDAGRLIGSVDGDGTVTEFIYDKASKVIKTVRYSVLLTASRLASLVDGSNNPTAVLFSTLRTEAGTSANTDQVSRNVYDNAGRLVYTIETIGIDPNLNTPIDAVTKLVYDGANRLLEEVQYKTTISIARATDQVLPSAVVTSDSTEDRRTRHFYDNSGNRLATLDGAGYLTEFTYDNAGHLITQFERANPVAVGLRLAGTLTQLQTSAGLDPAPPTAPTDTDPDFDIATYYYYDMQGRLSATLDGEGYYTKTNYDVAGNALSTVRYDKALSYTSRPAQSTIETDLGAATSHTQVREFDGAGRLTREVNYQGTATKYEYDGLDNVLSVRAAQGDALDERWTATRYDLLGRVTQELTAEGKALVVALGTNPAPAAVEDIWTRYGVLYDYDTGGRRKSATSRPNNTQTNVTLYFYDDDSRLRFEVNQLGERTEYKYNALGQLTDQIKYYNRIATSGLVGGLLKSLTQPQRDTLVSLSDSTRDAKTSYAYSLRGRQISSLTIEGAKVTQTYNTFGEMDSRKVGATGEDVGYGYTYTTRGQLQDTIRGGVTIETRGYDAFGRLTSVKDGRGKTSKTEYDRLGRVIATVDSLLGRSSISYDGYSRVKYTDDATANTNNTSYTYNDALLTTTMVTPEGVTVLTTETRHGETRSVTVSSGADGTVSSKSYTYDKNGRLLTVTDGGQLVETDVYDRGGRLTDVTDARGIKTTIDYDAANRVFTRIVDTPSTQWPTGNLLLKTTYAYDGEGRVIDVTDSNNVVTHTTYDRDGRVKEVAVDPTGLNLRTSYDYNTRNDTVTVTEMAGTLLPRRTQYLFDTVGRRKEEIVDPTSLGGTLNLRTQYKYDDADNLTRKIDSYGNSTWYVYDDKNRLTHKIDALGGLTVMTYDAVDRLASTRRYVTPISALDLAGLATNDAPKPVTNFAMPATSVNDRFDRSFYDKDGREKYSIDGLGVVTEQLFDAAGNVKRLRVISTVRMTLAYTDADDLYTKMGSAASTIDPADHVTWNAFDARGRVEFSINAIDGSYGSVRRFTYDGNGNVISTRAFATSRALTLATDLATLSSWATSNASAANDQVTRFWYDTADRQRFVLDAENGLVQTVYNDSNRTTTSISYKNPQTAVAALAANSTAGSVAGAISTNTSEDRTTIIWADTVGRTRLVLSAEGYLTQTRYDDNTGATSTTVYSATPLPVPDASTALATAAGYARIRDTRDRTTMTWFDAAGRERFSLDAEGYLAETRYLDSSSQVQNIVYFSKPTISATDSLTQVVTAAGNTPNQTSNQITTSTFDAAGRTTQVKDADNKSEYFVYDAVGNKIKYVNKKATSNTDPAYTWTYEYDANQNLTYERSPSVSVTTVDPITLIATEATVSLVTHNEYDAFGNVKQRTEAENVASQARVTGFEYDRLGRQTAAISPTVSVYNSTLDNETQTKVRSETSYDALGNAFRNRVAVAGAAATDGAFAYKAYDKLGRVKFEVDAKNQVTSYTYDAFGNKTQVTRHANALGSTTAWKIASSLLLSQVSVNANSSVDRTITTKYDRLGRATRVEQASAPHYITNVGSAGGTPVTLQPTTEYQYNAFGDVIMTREKTGSSTWATSYAYYNQRGLRTALLDPSRYLTEFFYDDATGDLTKQIEYALPTTDVADVDTFGTKAPSATGAAQGGDRETRFTYDILNRKTSETRVNVEYSYLNSGALQTLFTGLQTTTYGYDVLGNQTLVRVTNPADSTNIDTWTWYDVLGRAVTIAEPARDLGNGQSVIPLTRLQRDAHGNLVQKIEYYYGTGTIPTNGSPATAYSPAADRNGVDRYTTMLVDGRNNVVATRDATGAVKSASYNERGDIAKESQVVVNPNISAASTADDITDTVVTLYRYDEVGQQKQIVESQRAGVTVTRIADYNAFGEITAKYNLGVAEDEKTYYNYDQLGRVWRTNADDGVDKVYMFDVQGNATVELRSRTADLAASGITSAADALLAANLMRTETAYDLRGNVIERRMPNFDVSTGLPPVGVNLQLSTINGVAYVNWAGALSNTVTETFEYRAAGSTGAWLPIDVEQVSASVLGANVYSLYNAPYEYRARLSRGTEASIFAESTGTFRLDRGINTNYSSISVTPPDTSLDVQPIAIQQSGPINLTATIAGSEGWLGTYWYEDNVLNCDISGLGNIPVRVFVQYVNWNRDTPNVQHDQTKFWDLPTAAGVTQLRWHAAAGDQYGGLWPAPVTVTIMGLTAVGGTTTGTIAQTNAPAGPPMLIWAAPADLSVTAVFKYKRTADSTYSSVSVARFGGSQFRLDVANLLTSTSNYDYEIEYWKSGAVVSRRGGQMNSTGVTTTRYPNGTLADAALDAWSQNIPTPAVGSGYTLQWTAPPSNWGAVTATFGVRENGSSGAFVPRTITTGSTYSVSLADLPQQNTPYEYQIVYTLGGRTIAEQRGVVNLMFTPASTTTNVTAVATNSEPTPILPVSTVSGFSGVGSATVTKFGNTPFYMGAPYNAWNGLNGADVTFPVIPTSQSQYIKIRVYFTYTGGGSTSVAYEPSTVLSTATGGTTGGSAGAITWTPGTTTSTARITWTPPAPSGPALVAVTNVEVYLCDAAGGNKVLARRATTGVGSGSPPVLQWAAPTQSGLTVQFYVNGALQTSTLNGSTWSGAVAGYNGTNNYEIRYFRSGDPQAIVAATGQFTNDGITTGIVGSQTAISRNPSWLSPIGRSGNTVTWSRVADQGSYVRFEYSTDAVNYTPLTVVPSGDNTNFSASVQGFNTGRYYYRLTYASAPSGVLPYVKSEGYFDVVTNVVNNTTVLDRQNPHFNQQYGPARISPVTLPANSDVVSWSYLKNNASDTVKFFYTVGGTEYTVDLSGTVGASYSATMSALPIAANQSVTWRIEYRTSGQYQYAMANGTATITVTGTQQNPVISGITQSLRYPSGVLPLPGPTDLGGDYFGWSSLSPNGATVKFYLNGVETALETVGSTRRINLAGLTAGVTYSYELTFTDSGATYPSARVKGSFVPSKSPGGIISQNFTVADPRKETVFDVNPGIVTRDLVWPPNALFYEYLEQGGQLWHAFGPRTLAQGGGWMEEIPPSPEVPAGRYQRVEAFYKYFPQSQAITWPRIGGIDNTATMVYWSLSDPNTKIAMSVGDYNGTWTAYTTDASHNLINLANGTYGYRIEMRRSGATIPWGVQEGTFVRSNGAYTSVTPIPDTTPVLQNVTPTSTQSFDRWGNLLQSTDASKNITNYRYNARDQLVQTLEATDRIIRNANASPSTDIIDRAEKTNFYDLLGRLIETQDGYDQANRVTYNAAGQVVSKRNADFARYGGVTTDNVYDIFGNLSQTKDELGYRTRYKYDKAGRIKEIWREIVTGGFTDTSAGSTAGAAVNLQTQYFVYDELGRRVSETDGIDTEITRYRYDHRGNVTARLTPMQAQNGLMTSYAYDANGKLITETDAIGSTKSWTYYESGRVKTHTELTNSNGNKGTANAVTITYTYNDAGALSSEISTAPAAYTGLTHNIVYGYDTAGNLTSIQDNGVNRTTVYRYDAAGRRSREQVVVNGAMVQDTRMAYDGHNRISSIDDNRYRETVVYDANGNRSFVDVSYVDHTNRVAKTTLRYTYDEMNRVVNTGQYLLTLGGTTYTPFTYNARGDRMRVVSADTGMWEKKTVGSTVTYKIKENLNRVPVIEDYTYDGLGRLKTVTRNYETVVWNSNGTQVTSQNWSSTVQMHAYVYDKANRVFTDDSISFEGGDTSIARKTTNTYDLDGRQNDSTVMRGANTESVTRFGRSTLSGSTWSRGYDDAGNVRWYDVEFHNPDNGNTTYTTSYKSTYQLGEGYLERRQDATSEGNDQKPGPGYTTRSYDADGGLIRFDDSKDVNRSRVFVNNQSSQAITVVNGDFSTPANVNNALDYAIVRGNYGGWQSNYAHAQYYFFANGNMIGTFGQLQQAGTFVANFDVNYTPISGAYPGATPSTVVVQTGDTLRSIAGRVYGDASLWYVIAEENGLTDPDADLPDGLQLRIPNEVVSLSNTSESFKPFNPADALGDTTPTQPPPPAPKGCGVIGMIIMIVVMVVVTVFTAGVATAGLAAGFSGIMSAGATALGTAIGAAGGFASIGTAMAVGAVSSAVTQGIGVALGIQQKFDWGQVAMGAITAGIGGIAAKAGLVVKTGSTMFNAAANAVISNTLTQGVSMAVGLQKKFDWKSVAQSAVAAPLAAMAGDFIGNKVGVLPTAPGEYNFAKFASDATKTIVTAGVRSAMGGRFDVKQVAADIFGNAIGNAIVGSFVPGSVGLPKVKLLEKTGSPVDPDNDLVVAGEPADGEIEEVVVVGKRRKEPADINTVLTSDEKSFWKTHNPNGLSKQEIPDAEDALKERQEKKAEVLKEKQEVIDKRQKELDAGRAANVDPKKVLKLEENLAKAINKFNDAKTRQDRLVGEREAEITGLKNDLRRANELRTRVETWATGQEVTLEVPYLNDKGKTRYREEGYQIKGPRHEFDVIEDAAKDGIAFGFLVQKAMGDDWERGGMIAKGANGKFSYSRLLTGSLFKRDYYLDEAKKIKIPAGTPFMLGIGNNGVGFFHIHPDNGVEKNKDFSEKDLAAFDAFATEKDISKRGTLSFLGGSDGSFDRLTPDPNKPGSHIYDTLGRPGYFDTKRGK